MQINLNWKKGLFSSVYQLYSKDRKVGELTDRAFSQTASGNLNGKAYVFRTKGVFQQRTEIYEGDENKMIGEITYNSWMTKASIGIENKTYYWNYDNLWNTKWRIFSQDGIKIRYAGSLTSGVVESNTDEELLLLAGLFVINYYWQMMFALLVAVSVPLWAA